MPYLATGKTYLYDTFLGDNVNFLIGKLKIKVKYKGKTLTDFAFVSLTIELFSLVKKSKEHFNKKDPEIMKEFKSSNLFYL